MVIVDGARIRYGWGEMAMVDGARIWQDLQR